MNPSAAGLGVEHPDAGDKEVKRLVTKSADSGLKSESSCVAIPDFAPTN